MEKKMKKNCLVITLLGSMVFLFATVTLVSADSGLFVDSNGHVGINNSAPEATLDVIGNIAWGSTGAQLGMNQGAAIELRGNGVPYIDFSNDAVADYDMRLILTGDSNIGFYGGDFLVGGDIQCVDLTEISDQRFKKDIHQIEGSIEKLMKISGVSYMPVQRIHKGEDVVKEVVQKTRIGLIAQDVEKVFPEAVFTDSEGYKSLSYTRLIAPLIEAVKELNLENQALKAQLDEINAKLSSKSE
jgi:trimeric autotransporter adhesin